MENLIKKWIDNNVISEETAKILLEDINNETRCKVLRLAIQNKIKNEQES